MSAPIIFNGEPLGYSPIAREMWRVVGEYQEGDLGDAQSDVLARTTVLIVRLARRIDARVLDRCPRLTMLVSATTGLDHIDVDLVAKRGIELLSLRGETGFLSSIPSTAEHAFGLMLALLRNIVPASASVRAGLWQRDRFRGRQLKGRRLGLVGLGRTGRMVASYAAAFGMRVSYYDPHVIDQDFHRWGNLDELLGGCEIVSLHVHLTEQTQRIIGAPQLQTMPVGAWLINTSRGGLIDERALAAQIRSGRLAGVAVDVLDNELDGIATSPLFQAMRDGYNILITPHLGGATIDAMHECEEFIARKAVDHIARRLHASRK